MLTRINLAPAPAGKRPKRSFVPDFIAPSTAGIDFNTLKSRGITTCFIDLDGTVVSKGTYNIWESIVPALQKSGMAIYIATNRPKSRDLKNLKQDMGAVGVIHPVGIFGKPSKRYFTAALALHNLRREEVVMIGDRYIQDIFGANSAGVYSLLVRKMVRPEAAADRVFSWLEDRVTRMLLGRYS